MKPRWSLSAPAFDGLLRRLDEDPERAAHRYEELRHKLARFFEWRGCRPAEEHADEVLDRVARRLEGGEAVQNVGAYCYGIARLLLREAGVRDTRQRNAAAELRRHEVKPDEDDRPISCLEGCLQALAPEARALILEYYEGERRSRQEHRRDMAERLGIAPNALRIRLHRIRRSLESCLVGCLGGPAETNPPSPTLRAGGRDVVG